MDLTPYVDQVRHELTVAAEAGGEDARALAERLTAPLESAMRLTLLEVLSAAADEITTELAPGSVDLRLRGRAAEFVVALPSRVEDTAAEPGAAPEVPNLVPSGAEEGAMTRLNLRLSEHLKVQIEAAADREGLSANAWLVRAAATALQRSGAGRMPGGSAVRHDQRYSGWVR